jgi:hypothetical protein
MGQLIGRPGTKAARAVRAKTIPACRMAAALLSVMLLSGLAVAWPAASANASATVTLRFLDGDSYRYDCTVGQTWDVNAVVVEVENGCNTAVWLHQHANNTGESFCTSAVLSGDPPEYTYANLYISSSTASC